MHIRPEYRSQVLAEVPCFACGTGVLVLRLPGREASEPMEGRRHVTSIGEEPLSLEPGTDASAPSPSATPSQKSYMRRTENFAVLQ